MAATGGGFGMWPFSVIVKASRESIGFGVDTISLRDKMYAAVPLAMSPFFLLCSHFLVFGRG